MRNIHVLPTSQPSRLYYFTANKSGYYLYPNKQSVVPKNPNCVNQNIYITSYEKIKYRDLCLDKFNQIWKLEDKKLIAFNSQGIKIFSTDNISGHECKKIILTTDQDLIKDGVQAIDDEFLEWFVKNISCEKALKDSFKEQENMYSEENMIDFAIFYYTHQGKATKYWGKDLFNEWLITLKNKI